MTFTLAQGLATMRSTRLGSRVGRQLAAAAALGGCYFVAAKFGLRLAYAYPSATPVWPPTGLAIAALLVMGYRVWPGIFLGAFLANATTAGTVWTSLGVASGNTLEGLLGAYLVNTYAHGRRAFDHPRDVFMYGGLAGVLSPIVSASLGVTSLFLGGFGAWTQYRPIWFTWWLGDASGALIVGPLILLWSRDLRLRWNAEGVVERLCFLAALLLTSVVVFGGAFPHAYLTMPLLIWAAFRFGPRDAASALALLAGIAVWATASGRGPFAAMAPNDSLLLVQVYMGIAALATLPFASVVAEREAAANEDKRRTEESFRRMFADNPLPMWVYDRDTLRFLEVNDAAIALYGYSRDEFLCMRITDIRPPDEAGRLLGYLGSSLPRLRKSGEWRHVTKRGALLDVAIDSHVFEFSRRPAVLVVARDVSARKRAEDASHHRTAELEAFHDLSRRLRAAPTVDEMYPMIVDHATRLLSAEHGALSLLTPEANAFVRVHTIGIPSEKGGSTFPVSRTRSGYVVQRGVAFVTRDSSRDQFAGFINTTQHSNLGPLAIVPLRSEQGIIGTLGVARLKTQDPPPFTDAEVALLEGIAEVAGTAIRRARLQRDLEQSYMEVVVALAHAVDARDTYTADHSERMATRAVAVARALACPEATVQDIYWAALLHDIGKLSVPDSILRKPGPLTAAEWAIMREHPVVGERILQSVERMREVATLVRHHQERWDGQGYPDALRGEAIPLGARVLAVADTYSAITDDRVYSKGRSSEAAIAEIRRCAGTQFDPRVVEAFCRVLREERAANRPTRAAVPQPAPDLGPLATVLVRPFAQARQFRRLVPAMAEVSKRLLRPLDLSAVLEEVLSQIQQVFEYPICAIFFVDQRTRELYLRAQRGYDHSAPGKLRSGPGEDGIVGWVAKHGRPYYAPDVTADPRYVEYAAAARSAVAYPLVVDEQVIGVLSLASPALDAFPKEIRELLEAFAVLAALAILRAQRDEDLRRLALTDGLTGLANHRALSVALEREVALAKRHGSSVSVAMVELDRFKRINDLLGHLQGDVILRAVADAMKACCRAMDLPARFGGDEFVLLLPDASKAAAVQVAERLRRDIEEIWTRSEPSLTVSVGLATLPEDGDTASALLSAADRAMYDAKHVGGNRVSVA